MTVPATPGRFIRPGRRGRSGPLGQTNSVASIITYYRVHNRGADVAVTLTFEREVEIASDDLPVGTIEVNTNGGSLKGAAGVPLAVPETQLKAWPI